MTDLNDRIRQALAADDEQALARLAEEPDLFQQVLDTFRSRSRWLVAGSIVAGVVFMILAVICVVQFFTAPDIRSTIQWGFGAGFCLSAIMAMKIWYWMELQKNAVTREIKRLEIQVARLGRTGT